MLPPLFDQPATQPSAAQCLYIVGQDTSGHWLAVDTAHRSGGFFKSRADAIHFAAFESGQRPDGIRISPVPLRMEF